MIVLYILLAIYALVWIFLQISYWAIKFNGPEHTRALNFWQFIDYHFNGNFAKGLKGLDILIKSALLISWCYVCFKLRKQWLLY